MKKILAFIMLISAPTLFVGLTFTASQKEELPMPTKFAMHHLVLLKSRLAMPIRFVPGFLRLAFASTAARIY